VIRVAAGVLLAPLAVALPAFLYAAIVVPAVISMPDYGFDFRFALAEVIAAVIVAYAGMLVLGLPAHIALRWRRRVALLDYAIAGVALGAAAPLLLGLGQVVVNELSDGRYALHAGAGDLRGALLEAVFYIAAGPAVASAFWFVSVRK
jgi:hypothetical protein